MITIGTGIDTVELGAGENVPLTGTHTPFTQIEFGGAGVAQTALGGDTGAVAGTVGGGIDALGVPETAVGGWTGAAAGALAGGLRLDDGAAFGGARGGASGGASGAAPGGDDFVGAATG